LESNSNHQPAQPGQFRPIFEASQVLITSATDALAFLVGATTVLPALSWFCTYAGGEKTTVGNNGTVGI